LVTCSIGVYEAFAERHVPTTLAMNRSLFSKRPETLSENLSSAKPAGVEFRIATGKPADVSGWIGCFIGKM
jgi:hypothetical protein